MRRDHGNILKLIRKFAELTGGFGEGIQLEPLQVRRGGDHGLGNDDLPHNSRPLIQLAQIDADETFAVVSAGIGRGLRRGGGRSGLGIGGGFLLRGLRGRGLLLGGERLRGRGRNGAGLRAVKGLIGPDRAAPVTAWTAFSRSSASRKYIMKPESMIWPAVLGSVEMSAGEK